MRKGEAGSFQVLMGFLNRRQVKSLKEAEEPKGPRDSSNDQNPDAGSLRGENLNAGRQNQ